MSRHRVLFRPRVVLFVLLGFFLLVPLYVYHSFTTGVPRIASHPMRSFHSVPSSLPACLAIESAELLRPDVLHSLQKTRCGVPASRKLRRPLLRLVHFVHVALDAVPMLEAEHEAEDTEQFTYLQFAVVQSIRRAFKPDVMMMHYLETPRGVWYTQCQRHVGLHQVLPPVSFGTRHPTFNRQQRRQLWEVLIMLRTLRKQGGMAFSDFNTILLRSIGVDMIEDMVLASQANSSNGAFRVGLHVMQSPPGHPFVDYLERSITEMVETNDRRLHEMQLDEVVGQLVRDKYQEEHERDLHTNGSDPETMNRRIMDGVVIGTPNLFEFAGLHDLLHAKLEPSLAGTLRDVVGMHVAKYDFARKTDKTKDLSELARMQLELSVAEEWLTLDSLLGAVLRLVVTANTSAELDLAFTWCFLVLDRKSILHRAPLVISSSLVKNKTFVDL
ncbi:hypothetical protein PsorP6_017314 [Peronosclerospora sorghi]|uniref:Uncharacterized protein n=1 Tax=Peronosclerospora sorghi TaxID=230839 RepID=A0ACC0WKZ3_9STRA|nr:hypothetical protein PsorP6_017314 [Peronosclerospora sorghi]